MTAPWWGVLFGYGVPFGLAIGLYFGLVDGEGLATSVAFGASAVLVFGGAMLLMRHLERRRSGPILDQLSPEDRKVVHRAAWKGPVPADPDLVLAAVRLTEQRLDQLRRTNVVMVVAAVLVAAGGVLLLLDNPSIKTVVLLLCLLSGAIGHVHQLRRLRLRQALLTGGTR